MHSTTGILPNLQPPKLPSPLNSTSGSVCTVQLEIHLTFHLFTVYSLFSDLMVVYLHLLTLQSLKLFCLTFYLLKTCKSTNGSVCTLYSTIGISPNSCISVSVKSIVVYLCIQTHQNPCTVQLVFHLPLKSSVISS